MIAETIQIRENPCTETGLCFGPSCKRPALIHVCAAGSVVRASTFCCHGHVQDGHVKVLRMVAMVFDDSLAEARGEYEPVTF